MNLHIVTHHGDGTATTLSTDTLPLAQLGSLTSRRVSNILPVRPMARIAFLALRRAFGDKGRAAAWTRKWPGPWRAEILCTGKTAIFSERAACVRWEHDQIQGTFLEAGLIT